MEPTMQTTPNNNLFDLQIDATGMSYLRDAAKWARFLAVVGFICIGLIVLMGILFGTLFASMFNTLGSGAAFGGLGGSGIGAIYIGFALIYFFPCYFLNNFASRTKAALASNDQVQLNLAIKNARAVLRFLGVITIIFLGLWVIMILIVMVAAVGRL